MHTVALFLSLTLQQAPVTQVVPPEAQEVPLDVQKATDAYLAMVTGPETAKADAYSSGNHWLELWGWLANLAAAGVLLGAGLSTRIRALAERITRRAWLQPPLYALLATPALAVLSFPMRLYADFIREHQYGYSNLGLGAFLGDVAKEAVTLSLMTALGLTAGYAVIRRAPRTWWLWGAGVALAMRTFAIAVSPLILAPLYNTFTPIQDPAVRERVLRLARANGIDTSDVYQDDASKQDSRINAYVSGLGGTARIVLNDTLLQRASLPQIEQVVAHEIGHQALNHVPKKLLFLAIYFPLCFACAAWAFRRLHDRFGARWATRGAADPATWPLLLALMTTFSFLSTPVLNGVVRSQEEEADLFALNAAQQPDAEAQLSASAEYGRMSPGPLEEIFFSSHPSPRHRVEVAMRWKREHQAQAATQSPASSPR